MGAIREKATPRALHNWEAIEGAGTYDHSSTTPSENISPAFILYYDPTERIVSQWITELWELLSATDADLRPSFLACIITDMFLAKLAESKHLCGQPLRGFTDVYFCTAPDNGVEMCWESENKTLIIHFPPEPGGQQYIYVNNGEESHMASHSHLCRLVNWLV